MLTLTLTLTLTRAPPGEQGHLANATLFPAPGPMGKGVLVQTTLWGNLILGPTARDLHLLKPTEKDLHDPTTIQANKDALTKEILTKSRYAKRTRGAKSDA